MSKNNKSIEKIAINNNIKSRFWIFRVASKLENALVFPFEEEVKLILPRIRNNKKWARVLWVELPPNNYHSYELDGISEFDSPRSLDWVQENICFRADWDVLALPPDTWCVKVEKYLKQNHAKFHYVIK
jgi:hypothetical protein